MLQQFVHAHILRLSPLTILITFAQVSQPRIWQMPLSLLSDSEFGKAPHVLPLASKIRRRFCRTRFAKYHRLLFHERIRDERVRAWLL